MSHKVATEFELSLRFRTSTSIAVVSTGDKKIRTVHKTVHKTVQIYQPII